MKTLINILGLSLLVSSVTAQNFDRSIRPQPSKAGTVQMKDAVTITLANGLKVFVVENHKLPTVSYMLQLDVEPVLQGKAAGLEDMVGELMLSGTKNRSKDAFNKELDALGGTLSPSSRGIYASCLVQHQDKMLGLMTDMLYNADFKQAELDKLKTNTLSGLKNTQDDPDAKSNNLIKGLVYGKQHPYGEIVTEATTKAITLDACKNFYKTYFRPNVAYLAIVGDVTEAQARVLAEKHFGSWQKGMVPKGKYLTPKQNTTTKVALVNQSDAVQSVINVSYPIDLKPGTQEGIKLRVAESILGGGASGRLFMNLREKHSWTYGSYASIQNDKMPMSGSFNADAKSKTEATDSSVAAIFDEMNRMRNETVDEKTVENAKRKLAGNFALSLENPRNIAQNAINLEMNKMDKNYYKNYLTNLSNVTAADVQTVSKKYIDPSKATVVIAGDKPVIAEKLKRFAASGKIDMYDMYANPIKELISKTGVVEKVNAKDVITKYIAAVGGADNWQSVKDITINMEIESQGQKLEMNEIKKAPNKYFQELKAGAMTVQKKIFDGVKGKEMGMGGEQAFDEAAIAEMKEDASFLGDIVYLDPSYKVEAKGIEDIDGKPAYKIIVTTPSKKTKTIFYDKATGFKVKEINVMEAEGKKMQIAMFYSDYKQVSGGLKYAFKIKQVVPQGPPFEIRVTKIETNTGVPDSIFEVK